MVDVYSFKVKISLTGIKTIYWPIVLLMMARYFGLSEKIIFFIVTAAVIYIMGISKKIVVPNVNGLWIYSIMIIFSGCMGFILNGTRNLARDIFYVLPTIVFIILGYYLERFNDKQRFSMINTMIVYGGLISFMSFLKALSSVEALTSFDAMRSCFGKNNIYEVCVVFAVFFFKKIISKEVCVSKWIDRVLGFFMAVQITLCLGRIAIIQTGASIIMLFIFSMIKDKQRKDNLKKMVTFLLVVCIGVFILSKVMPQSTWDQLMDKFNSSAEEINSSQTFDSTEDAMENWRGYEIEQAKKQWENNNVLFEIIGEGLGKGVEIAYVPYTWSNIVVSGEIPLLHNGYYTLLPKTGIVGVCALIWLFLSNILIIVKKDKKYTDMVIILAAITIGVMINTYVVRGPISQIPPISWALLLGTINYNVRRTG